MIEFLRELFSSDFMGHGYCYLWKPDIVWLHAVSDGLIALAYYVIPVALVYFVRKRRDLPFHWMFFMFGIFIFGCGTTHALEVWTLWHGTYRLAGIIKALTAVASMATAVALVPLIPRALLLPSPGELCAANLRMEREMAERLRAEEALRTNEERLRLAVRATNDAIWDIDFKSGTISWNDTYSVLYGRPGVADSWQFWIDRIHPEDRARTVDDFQAAVDSGALSWSAEYRFRRVDGEWAYIYDRA
jgi:PAS domain-containing protein